MNDGKMKTKRAPIEIQSGNIIFKYPLQIDIEMNREKHTPNERTNEWKNSYRLYVFAEWMTTETSQVKLNETELNQPISTIEPINSVDVIHSKFLMDHIFAYTYQTGSHLYWNLLPFFLCLSLLILRFSIQPQLYHIFGTCSFTTTKK